MTGAPGLMPGVTSSDPGLMPGVTGPPSLGPEAARTLGTGAWQITPRLEG